ncbi:phosphomethylpyrimidine synthase ThiC [Fervidobacterium sp. 2310opik-2]|uniref:phosphomethylpyrimidine synthase ThiC n=1 Tax=Fervidobacterium sp. 2310opik-2 TaxID=1755815 RepID=UPI0013DE7F87|nr:phosphomethylpyrimidine synthase ThiC [Fervidobacterium sp. 2310opik-2]KAF2961013.1 phosphomethylpyrimidine synthase [Fervidobacterium sp. 2310opik-2]
MTQLEMARNSQISPEMTTCAQYEVVDVKEIIEKLALGKAVIPKNKIHKISRPMVVGEGFSVKVNANIGTSLGYSSLEEEIEKLKVAIDSGADSVMVLSTWGDLKEMRRILVEMSPVPVGSVPIYDSAVLSYKSGKNVVDFSEKDFIDMVKSHAEDGIDFMTIHVGITKNVLEKVKNNQRILKIVSRGGAIVTGWMIKNNKENPFYEYFDEILDIAREYDVTLSLGDGMRPGAILDATDHQQLEELFVMRELVERAWEKGVQVMLEGPGHVPLNDIEMNVKLMKKVGKGAPIFLLGPLPTDRGVGYDHIVSAIGGALAAYYGADFLCYVTPSEHVSLPTVEDVKEGVIASKIAATIADVARGNKKALELEKQMAIARSKFDWEKMFELAIHSEKAKDYLKKRPYEEKGCSMCGPFCAIKIANEYAK